MLLRRKTTSSSDIHRELDIADQICYRGPSARGARRMSVLVVLARDRTVSSSGHVEMTTAASSPCYSTTNPLNLTGPMTMSGIGDSVQVGVGARVARLHRARRPEARLDNGITGAGVARLNRARRGSRVGRARAEGAVPAVGVINKLPRAVAVRAFQRVIEGVESVTFYGDALRAAGHAHDGLTARSRNQAPVGFAGDRVRIETTQMVLGYGKALVLEEILQRVRVLMTGREVRGDRQPVGMPDEQQLRLTLALLGGAPHPAHHGQHEPNDNDRKEQADVGESALWAEGTSHSLTRMRTACRRRQPPRRRYGHRGCRRDPGPPIPPPSRCPRAW